MKTELVHTLTNTFEAHAQRADNGVEFWLARDIQYLLGYAQWRNFVAVINKAKTACEVSSRPVTDHFADVSKMVDLGSGSQDFALIRSKGDHALFGKSTQAMKSTWNVPDTRPLADFAPTILLKAKDFATEITIFNTRAHQLGSERAISTEHITNNEAVRNTLLSRGIRPENLPAAEDVKKVERRLASEDKKSIRNPDALDD